MRVGPINAATPTPLKQDGSFDLQSARRLAKRWVDLRLDGVLVLGTMGEGTAIADCVRDSFVETALAEAGGKVTLFAGAADASRERMRERACRYAAMGADCVILCLPPNTSSSKAVADLKCIADACPAPCGYYDVPALTGTVLALGEMLDLLSHQNIRVLKDSSNNPLLAQALTSREFRPRVPVLDGVEYRTAYSRLLGYDGVLHGGAVLTARRVRAIWEDAANGCMEAALALDRENSLFLGTIYNRFSWPLQNTIGQKYALKLLGVLDCEAVGIDQTLDERARERIRQVVEAHRSWLE